MAAGSWLTEARLRQPQLETRVNVNEDRCQALPLTSSLLMGTDGCRRFPISRRCSKRSASSFILSPSVFPMASSTKSRIFLIWVTVRVFHAQTPTTSWFQTANSSPLTTTTLNPGDARTDKVSAVSASRSWAASGTHSSSPTASFFCRKKQAVRKTWKALLKLCPVPAPLPSSSPRCSCCRGSWLC